MLNEQQMKPIRLLLILSAITCLCVTWAGCTVSQPGNANSNSVVTQPSPSPSATASPERAHATSSQVTLPLLDALLTNESFVRELKTTAKLSDEQIDSLKRVSQSEIARLRETNAEEVDGNGSDARAHASEQLKSIVGDEKAKQVASLANDFWSKGEATDTKDNGPEMLAGPNAVPTDTRVVVNIPAFRMDLFQDGNLVKSYLIGIGYPEFPLPQGLRKAQTIIFNPTWTPPDSPWVASMKNVTAGETVAAGDKLNPLGPIKIPIGLPSLIHGGKSPAKLGKFASHGCVGLTNAQIKDFAVLLGKAANTELSEKTVASYLQDREKTQSVKLGQMVPVELRYETIVLEDGKLHIYKDVYAQETNTEENLRKVLDAHGVKFDDLPEPQRTQALNALKAAPKGQKETVIDLSGFAQKGYPAPVNLDSGKAVKTNKRG